MEEIKNYIGWTYKKHTGAFEHSIEELGLTLPTVPPDPAIGDAITSKVHLVGMNSICKSKFQLLKG